MLLDLLTSFHHQLISQRLLIVFFLVVRDGNKTTFITIEYLVLKNNRHAVALIKNATVAGQMIHCLKY